MNKLQRAVLLLAVLPVFLTVSACSMVKVDERNASQTINAQRGSIVTKNTLSTQTSSSLMSYGIDSRACLVNFDICLDQLQEVTLLKPKREVFALLAELYYAKALQIANAGTCQTDLQRPPIDPYYPNAYSSNEFMARKQVIDKACSNTYVSHLISSIRYSYAYLFYDSLDNDFDEDFSVDPNVKVILTDISVQTKDIYNAATSDLIKTLYSAQADDFALFDIVDITASDLDTLSSNTNVDNADTDLKLDPKHSNQLEVLRLSLSHLPIYTDDSTRNSSVTDSNSDHSNELKSTTTTLSVYLPDETDYIYTLPTSYSEQTGRIEPDDTSKSSLYSSFDLNYSGLRAVSKREGFGVSFVTLLSGRRTTSITDFVRAKDRSNNESPESRIYRTGNLLLTGIVIPQGDSVEEVLSGEAVDIKLYNPRHVDRTEILGQSYGLKANFSASYGLWLSENSLSSVGYLNMLSRQQTMVLPELFLLEPYDPNKRVIIMTHGLASSPATWVGITNDIFNDSKLRESYQVWQVFYPTQIPMLENRYQIQKLIETAFDEVDPSGQDIASQHSVLIGHSMGAVISRMMLSNDNLNDKLSTLAESGQDTDLSQTIRQSYIDQNIDNRLKLHKLEQVDKAVFISAPFRGTDFADRWFTRALRRIVQLPLGFIQTVTGNLTSIATKGELTANPLGALYLQNGASQLSDQSSFMKLTRDLEIDDSVTYHSIIANNDPDIAQGLAQLSNTETKISLSEYRPNKDTYDYPYRPDKIPLSDINLDEETLDKLSSSDDKSSNNNESINNVSDLFEDYSSVDEISTDSSMPSNAADNSKSSTLIATVKVNGMLDPSIAHEISDGIVPYTSAHLDGAKSETIVSGTHSIQDTSQAILLLRKILRDHLDEYPVSNSQNTTEPAKPTAPTS